MLFVDVSEVLEIVCSPSSTHIDALLWY